MRLRLPWANPTSPANRARRVRDGSSGRQRASGLGLGARNAARANSLCSAMRGQLGNPSQAAGAGRPLADSEVAGTAVPPRAAAPISISLGAALAILAAAEILALRLAWTVAAAPAASAPLNSVEAVAALLPLPVFAALPASGHPRPLAPKLTDDGLSPGALWLLACEGSLAAMLFLTAAMTSQNIGFPAELCNIRSRLSPGVSIRCIRKPRGSNDFSENSVSSQGPRLVE